MELIERNIVGDPKFSFHPDLPDHRDVYYAAVKPVDQNPGGEGEIDLSDYVKKIWDQGEFGSCTQFSSGRGLVQCEVMAGMPEREISCMQTYWNMRALMKSGVNNDAGGNLRAAMKSLSYWGAADLDLWPYDKEHFALNPTPDVVENASKHKLNKYLRLNQNLQELFACLQEGYGFTLGISLFDSFNDVGNTGVATLPEPGENMEGGHALWCDGISMKRKTFQICNSWSKDWGRNGHFELPFAYALNPDLACDFWTPRIAA